MKLISLIVGLIMTFGIVNQVYAGGTSAAEFIGVVEKATGDDKFWLLVMLREQYDGYGWVNARLNAAGRKKVFCVPGKLIVKKERLFKILKNYAENTKAGRRVAYVPYGGVLLNAIILKWPC